MPSFHRTMVSASVCLTLLLSACQDKISSTEQNLQQATSTQADEQKTDEQHSSIANDDSDAQAKNPHDMQALLSELQDGSVDDAQTPTAKPITTANGKTQIDWSYIDTKTKRVDANSFAYPFAKDSQPVMNYAKAYDLTPEQAQYAMMLSMASPEALGKILDQLTGKYIAHSFRDGDNPALIIQTTADVVGEKHDYVIADKFGEGLVLPIEIIPADK